MRVSTAWWGHNKASQSYSNLDLDFYLSSRLEVDLLQWLGSLSWITQVCLSFWNKADVWTFSFRILLAGQKLKLSWYSKAIPDPHTTTTILICWDNVHPSVGPSIHPWVKGGQVNISSGKYNHRSSSVTPWTGHQSVAGCDKVFLKCSEDIGTKMCFFNGTFPWRPFSAQSVSYCWIMITDLKWDKRFLQCFRCCGSPNATEVIC